MLASFLKANRALLDLLAKTWLDSGATGFSIWVNDNTPLAQWGVSQNGSAPFIEEEIQVRGRKIGRIRLTGPSENGALKRLHMDATLIAALVTRENDIMSIADEWIATRDQLLALYHMTHHTGRSLDINHSLEQLAQDTHNVTKAMGVLFAIQFDGQPLQTTYYPIPLLDLSELEVYIQELYREQRDFLFVENALSKMPHIHLLLKPFETRGSMTAVVGIYTETDRSSIAPTVKLLETIAEFAGTHIENLQMVLESMRMDRLQTELELARNVQRSLLPTQVPSIPGIDLWAETRSASVMGGDFYDFYTKRDAPLMLAVGDISGKGMPASLPMAMTRTMLRAYANSRFPAPTPQHILESTNNTLYDDFNQLGMFVTTFVGQYNPGNHELVFANAGHSPIIYYQANGGARLLEAADVPVGLFQNIPFENQRLLLNQGDVLVVGTDGLYEVHNQNGQSLGYECLVEQVADLSDRSSKDIAEHLLQTSANFRRGETQEDDQTIVVLKRTAE